GAERGKRLLLGLRAGAGDDFRAEELRELHAGDAHTAARAQNEDLLTAGEASLGDEHAVSRAVRERETRRVFHRHLLGHRNNLRGGDRDILRTATLRGLADHAEALTVSERPTD